jgi:hypothetical protein
MVRDRPDAQLGEAEIVEARVRLAGVPGARRSARIRTLTDRCPNGGR